MQNIYNKTILLVEDEAIIAMNKKNALEHLGYNIIVVHSGEKAILQFKNKIDIDIILMDIDLGKGLDGTETAEAILKIKDVPIIFLSSHSELEIVERTEKITSYGYVVKDSGIAVLDASIKMAFKLFDANKRLQENEIKQKSMMANISDVIAIISPRGIIRYCTPNIQKIFGWNKKAITGKNSLYMIHPEDLTLVRKKISVLLKTENLTDVFEFRYRCKNNEYKFVELIATNLMNDPTIKGILLNFHDINERKLIENALEKRIIALTKPLTQSEEIIFEDLFDLEVLQQIQDEFALATGVASIITHPDGTPITKSSNFSRLCSNIIRCTEAGKANCFRSDSLLGRHHPEGPIIQPCLSGGLWDAGASITIGNRHVANWLIGQVRDETQSEQKIREYAKVIGSDEEETVKAFYEVNNMSLKQFTNIANALFTLANQLSTTAYQNIQQARLITALKKAEEKNKKLLEEKEILLKEVHHRIKNNMSMINSLLNLQANTLKDPSATQALNDASSRIQSMIFLYNKLFKSTELKQFSMKDYIPALVDEIINIFPEGIYVKIIKNIDDFSLDINYIQPLGIILNELLTNIMKYAFIEQKNPEVKISASLKNNSVSFIVSDNGKGIPNSIDFDKTTGFGLNLAKMLTKQLDGKIYIKRKKGTEITLKFEI